MGTRRLRDLSKRQDVRTSLFEICEDRRHRAKQRFDIPVFADINRALAMRPDCLIISTPPNHHHKYIQMALAHELHHFCEVSMWVHDFEHIEAESARKGLICAPSCTMQFLPVIKELERVVKDELGTLHAYQMCLSTYAPSWHPGEGSEYYARHSATAPAREMVPFELRWLNEIFGTATEVSGSISRQGQLEIDAYDTICLQMNLNAGEQGQLVVSMASPRNFRRGCFLGSNGSVAFDVISGDVSRQVDVPNDLDVRNFGTLADILECTYKTEIDTFIDTVLGKCRWPLSYRHSSLASATLAAAEKSVITRKWELVDPSVQPNDNPPVAAATCR